MTTNGNGFGACGERGIGAARTHRLRRAARAASLAVLAAGCFATGCRASGRAEKRGPDGEERRCQAEPLGSVLAFAADLGDSGAVEFRGTVVSHRVAAPPELERLLVRDAAGRERRIAFSAPAESLPVRVGEAYGFRIEHRGESPRCSAILVWDRRGLCYAAASDTRPGEIVLHGGVPGFAIGLEPHRCPSRAHDPCIVGIYNTTLRVSAGTRSVALAHGDSARLAGWRLRCLTAQQIEYSPRCADAARIGVAYVLRRAD